MMVSAKRRRWQFGIFGLLVFVTLVCCIAAIVRRAMAPYLQQHQAIISLEQRNVVSELEKVPVRPFLLSWIVSPDKLYHVERITLTGENSGDFPEIKKNQFSALNSCFSLRHVEIYCWVTDADVACLRSSRDYLESLTIYARSHEITDAGLSYLADCARLRVLQLALSEKGHITDAGLNKLVKLPNLERLNVRGSRVTDVGIALLAKMGRLRSVNVSQTDVSHVGVNSVLENCRLDGILIDDVQLGGAVRCDEESAMSLTLFSSENTAVGDEIFPILQHAPKLEWLSLRNTGVTDDGINHLRRHPILRDLYLDGTSVSDRCISVLLSMPNLGRVGLTDTYVTPRGEKALRSKKPRVDIVGGLR